ncbi:unnamed protein product, partial [Gulo gulo]
MGSNEGPGRLQAAVTQHYRGQPPHLLPSTSDFSGPPVQSRAPSRVGPFTLLLGTARRDKLPFQSSAQRGNQMTHWALDMSNRLPDTRSLEVKRGSAKILGPAVLPIPSPAPQTGKSFEFSPSSCPTPDTCVEEKSSFT